MKKVKNTAAPEPKTVASDKSLTVVVYHTSKQPLTWLESSVLSVLQRSRHQVNLVVISAVAEELLKQPTLTDWVAAGKCSICTNIQEINIATSHFFVADSFNATILEHAIHFYCTLKKAPSSEQVCIADKDKSSGKSDINWGTRIKYAVYNTFGQLLMPTAQKNHTYVFLFFPTVAAQKILTPHSTNAQLVLANAAYNEFSTEHIPLTSREVKHHLHQWSELWGNAFKSRLNWFVLDAIKTGNYWRTVFAALVLVSLFAFPILSQQFGLTWDEPRHNDYSKLSLNYFTTFGEDTTCLQANIPTQEFRYYGEHFNVIAAFLYNYMLPLDEYETRHLLNALYGFLAILFAALIAKELAGWRAASIAILSMAVSPVFFAHSMNNPTDIPFATGFAIAIYYLFKMFKSMPAPKRSHLIMAAVGIGMAVGSRVGGILLYAYAALFFGINWLLLLKQQGTSQAFKQVWKYAQVFIVLVLVGHAFSVSLWPFGQQSFFTSWYEAFKKSTEGAYFTYNHELFEGVRMYMGNVPWYYLPKFIIINSPLVVLAGFALLVLLGLFLSKRFSQPILIGLLFFTVLFPIVYAEFKSLYYYNGWRHYLFIYPSIIACAAIGWEMLTRLVRKELAFIPILMAGMPLVWMIQNHPNQTVYFNELVGGTAGAYGKYEMDYYSNSCREAGEWLAKKTGNETVVVAINNKPEAASHYALKINSNMQFQWVREYEEQKTPWDYAIITSRTYSSNELLNGAFPPAGTIHTIDVEGKPICAIVKRNNYWMPEAYQALERRSFDTAAYLFSLATTYQPMDEEVWRMLGVTYTAMNRADSAELCLRKAIEIYPENYKAYNDLGLLYINVIKDTKRAMEQFDLAIKHKYNFSDAYYYASATLLNQNEYLAAIPYLENGIKRGGNGVAEMHYNLGYAYMNTNNNKKAEEYIINALNMNPNLTMGYRILAEIYNRMGRPNESQQMMQRYQQLGGR